DDARLLERASNHFAGLLKGLPEGAREAPASGEAAPAPQRADSEREERAAPSPPRLSEARPRPAVEERRPEPARAELTGREILVCRGFVNTLLLSAEIDVVVFSLWNAERAELYVGARRPFSDAGRSALLRELEAAVKAAAPGLKPPRERLFNTEYPFGPGAGEIGEFAGIQTSLVSIEPAPLLLTIVFSQAPAAALTAALTETHRLVRSALTDVRASSRYRGAYRSLVNFLLEPGTRGYPQLKAHGLAVGFLARRFATH